jgi:hypothetical protein
MPNGNRRAEACPPYLGDPITPEQKIDIVQQVPEK